MMIFRTILTAALLTGVLTQGTTAEDSPSKAQVGDLSWHTDYYAAYREARAKKKLLFLFFRDRTDSHAGETYANDILADRELTAPLGAYVRAVLPVEVTVPAADSEETSAKLLDHRAFQHMQHRQGIAVMDLIDDEAGQFGKLISAHPFTPGKYYTLTATRTVLGLPRASITQRALIYAIRVHPESPRSTNSALDTHLLTETRNHSRVMANMEQVGHHAWSRRYQELMAKYGRKIDVCEVAAVSWGGESLINGAKDCVAAWRQSSGHWAGVSGVHLFYGYDLVRGASGKWYATGLFATRR